ncbi:MAG: YihA family ribosome biogenesis GTP-binding protein [Gammaproteobacteria bacterium]|nr:MAG: YihA family ribosome biogenesis GTP-binding protein [Gammaproteobacteria bacterium]
MPAYPHARFLLSALDLAQLAPYEGAEVALAGRSNAGKSSTLNALVGASLAKASKTPGRTRAINLFAIEPGCYLADLPGYGYARMPEAMAKRLQGLMAQYLARRPTLRGLILVMDIRHPLKASDWQLLERARRRGLPVRVLLNKRDKLSRSQAVRVLRAVEAELAGIPGAAVQLFSARTGEGVEETRKAIEGFWQKKAPVRGNRGKQTRLGDAG